MVVLRAERIEQTTVGVWTVPDDVTLARVSITALVTIDEIVVRETQSCCLEVALLSIRVHTLVGQARVRAVTRAVVKEDGRTLLLAIRVWLPTTVSHLELRLLLGSLFLGGQLQLVLWHVLLFTGHIG